MSTTMTRQELVAVTEGAKNKIIERLVTKYDVQVACDNARDHVLETIQSLHTENQALLRQSNAQRDLVWRKTVALEDQIANLQHEIRTLQQMVRHVYDQHKDGDSSNQT